jgi:hypothetical protein
VYIVLNDFGQLGRAYVETDEAKADEKTVVSDIISASTPRWRLTPPRNGLVMSQKTIARALLERDAREGDLSESAKEFVERVLDVATLP